MTFLDNKSTLGLYCKLDVLGTSRLCLSGIPPDLTLGAPQVRPTRPLCFPVSGFFDAFALRRPVCLSALETRINWSPERPMAQPCPPIPVTLAPRGAWPGCLQPPEARPQGAPRIPSLPHPAGWAALRFVSFVHPFEVHTPLGEK